MSEMTDNKLYTPKPLASYLSGSGGYHFSTQEDGLQAMRMAQEIVAGILAEAREGSLPPDESCLACGKPCDIKTQTLVHIAGWFHDECAPVLNAELTSLKSEIAWLARGEASQPAPPPPPLSLDLISETIHSMFLHDLIMKRLREVTAEAQPPKTHTWQYDEKTHEPVEIPPLAEAQPSPPLGKTCPACGTDLCCEHGLLFSEKCVPCEEDTGAPSVAHPAPLDPTEEFLPEPKRERRYPIVKKPEAQPAPQPTPPKETISDGFGSVWSAWCPECECMSMYVCRPGDARCSHCYDGGNCPNKKTAEAPAQPSPRMDKFIDGVIEEVEEAGIDEAAASPSAHSALECKRRTCAQHRDLWRHYEDNIAQNAEIRDATKLAVKPSAEPAEEKRG